MHTCLCFRERAHVLRLCMFNGCIFIMTGFRGGKCAVCVAGIFIITQRWLGGGGEGEVEGGVGEEGQ